MNVQAWLELDTSLQIMFKLELVIKYKNLNSTWLGLIHLSNQAQTQYQAQHFEFEIQNKYIIKPISNLLFNLFGLY